MACVIYRDCRDEAGEGSLIEDVDRNGPTYCTQTNTHTLTLTLTLTHANAHTHMRAHILLSVCMRSGE